MTWSMEQLQQEVSVFCPGCDYTPPMADALPGSDSSSESDDHMIDPSLREDQSQSSDPASVCLL